MATEKELEKHQIELDKLAASRALKVNEKMAGVLERYRLLLIQDYTDRRILDERASREITFRAQVLTDLTGLLQEAGQEEAIEEYLRSFQPLAKKSLQYFSIIGYDEIIKGGASRQTLEAYMLRSEALYRENINRVAVQPVEEALFESIIGGVDRTQVVARMQAAGSDLKTHQLNNFVDEEFTKFQRVTTNLKGKELGLDIVVYLGPFDGKTSQQCRDLLTINKHGAPGYYFVGEVTQDLTDNLPVNPLVNGGHYNCRHKFGYVDRDFAESQGFKA